MAWEAGYRACFSARLFLPSSSSSGAVRTRGWESQLDKTDEHARLGQGKTNALGDEVVVGLVVYRRSAGEGGGGGGLGFEREHWGWGWVGEGDPSQHFSKAEAGAGL